jgi:ATP-dependent Clp protease ATP-binding subunit ClpC
VDTVSAWNYQSLRARKARFSRSVSKKSVKLLLWLVAVSLLVGGLTLVIVGSAVGWLLAGLSGPVWMLLFWIDGELAQVPRDPHAATLDGWIDSSLLGILPQQSTPAELSDLVMHLPGGRFFAVRFGFGTEFLPSLASRSEADTDRVWTEAENVRQQLGTQLIDASILTVALVRTIPQIETALARLKLDLDDLTSGARWYAHIQELLKLEHHKAKVAGGIGRDWSFGFTPLLSKFGTNLSEEIMNGGLLHRELEGHGQVHHQMMQLLAQGGRHNAVLVGPFGSGKTTIVRAFAKHLLAAEPGIPPVLRFRQVIELDPSTLIAQAKGRGELEMLVQNLCYEALKAKNVILFFDEAQLFFEEAQGSVNLSNILLPIIEGGALPIILAVDEQRWQRIALQNTAISQYMNRIVVVPTNKDETMAVLQDQLLVIEYRQKVTYMYQALDAAYDLSSRYMNDQAMPGKALKLLESAAHCAEQGFVTTHSVQQAIEQTMGVKVGTADTDAERETLLNLEDLIHRRMINQARAVSVVSDALRRARAGVRNTQRPIGTFLFLGPTGVGKTELAKSLAGAYFGGDDRLVRIDLNEYVQPNDVQRLIAAAATDPNSLTAQIGRQPFSVVLLDEIEKAHDNVLSTLLQLLDEGILRDINNREVSFRDAIIIATSNAGADRIRQHIEAGQQLEQFEQEFTNELINANVFRPEFLNRFDEIVLFRPLNQDELVQVIDLILVGLNKNLAAQKISVTVDDDAKRMLVQAGYDPRLGARPMRRIVQRVVENLVAKRMLSGQVMPGDAIHLTTADVHAVLDQTMVAR